MSCPHVVTEPVTLAMTGQWVGNVCADCWADLPLNWGCESCSWDHLVANGRVVKTICTSPCPAHQLALIAAGMAGV